MVRSLEPLEIYAYRMFWIRAANKPFSLDHFDDYEKHFTVRYMEGDYSFNCISLYSPTSAGNELLDIQARADSLY